MQDTRPSDSLSDGASQASTQNGLDARYRMLYARYRMFDTCRRIAKNALRSTLYVLQYPLQFLHSLLPESKNLRLPNFSGSLSFTKSGVFLISEIFI
ncbi:MAG TPA: hypothetical protein ENK14_06470 [Caldithrix sp.]|nr:hypothetical protein [Caldithrix sp.]